MFRRVNTKIFLIAIFILSTLFAVNTFAQDTTGGTNILQQYKAIYNSNTPALENWGRSNFETMILSILDALLNIDLIPDNILAGNLYDQNGNYVAWTPGGMVGSANNITSALFSPSASGVEYIAHLKDNLLGKPAYAQNSGASADGLLPLLPIWRQFRNIIYVLSSIVFVIIGVLVILRIKISPQAVITIQAAVPQLIITLILVTFSYAIAGFMIDFTNLLQGLFVVAVWPSSVNNTLASFANMLPGIRNLILDGTTAVNPTPFIFLQLMVIPQIVSSLMAMVIAPAIGSVIGIIGGPVGVLVGGTAGAVLGTVGSVVILVFFVIVMMINLVKLILGLIKVYGTIIFKIIVSPLEIGMGAFPGSKMGFDSWLTDIFANLMVFPIVFLYLLILNRILISVIGGGAVFMMANVFNGSLQNIIGGLWAPGIVGGGQFGALGPSGSLAIFGIAFSGMSILAKLPELIPQLIFNMKNPWGQAIGQATKESLTSSMLPVRFGAQMRSNQQRSAYEAMAPGARTTADEAEKSFWDLLKTTGQIK